MSDYNTIKVVTDGLRLNMQDKVQRGEFTQEYVGHLLEQVAPAEVWSQALLQWEAQRGL